MSRRPRTDADRKHHARIMSADRTWRIIAGICRSCDQETGINPQTGENYISCKKHRKEDAKRKKESRNA